ncbi:hypothetical protein D3C76_1367970 [compost metagenome]|nr:hypothetical protein PPUN110474_24190 [Pseudomonas putida]
MSDSRVDEPISVVCARTKNFGLPITGYLSATAFDEHLQCLVGVVYGESRGRFRDGAWIRTSPVERQWEHECYSLFRTFNGSTYVVCDWLAQDLGPRFTRH